MNDIETIHQELLTAAAALVQAKDDQMETPVEWRRLRGVLARAARNAVPSDMAERCTRARADIASLADWIECELDKDEHEEATLVALGTLDHVRDDLKCLLAFFSGVEATEIQRSLDELHM